MGVAFTDEELHDALDAYEQCGTLKAAGDALGISKDATLRRVKAARIRWGITPHNYAQAEKPDFYIDKDKLLEEAAPLEDIMHRRRQEFRRKQASEKSRDLIRCTVNIDGPIAILHGGDPHVDDPGTSIDILEKHVELIKNTEGLFGANVGDYQNAWVGRLAKLYAHSTVSEAETWKLVEWLVTSVDWIYLIGGNHDSWVGNGDPIEWMARRQAGVYQSHGARIGLKFPNGKVVRINARHDWPGHSQWNPSHGPAKAAQMGIDDHVVISGHRHISGYQIVKQPNSGLITHAIRVASYKIYDNYAKELGLRNQNVSPAVMTVINPDRNDDDPGLVTVLHDMETGADFLKFLRKKV
tara:strand:- start:1245 stop:2306 length:1062 start_codon:yes stop_codon:yes gene_type:complete